MDISAVVASVVSITACHPADTVKSMRQRGASMAEIYAACKARGVSGIYKGVMPSICTYPVFWGMYFGIKQTEIMQSTNPMINSYVSACLGSIASNPLFVIKTRAQVANVGTMLTIRAMFAEGVQSFYKGTPATMVSNLKLAVQFPLYYYAREHLDVVTSSLIAKSTSTIISYPLDVIRVYQRTSTKPMTMCQAYAEIGWKNMYRGLGIHMFIYSWPQFALMMAILEALK